MKKLKVWGAERELVSLEFCHYICRKKVTWEEKVCLKLNLTQIIMFLMGNVLLDFASVLLYEA